MDRIDRPDAIVLPAGALVPPGNLIAPAPNQFTHELSWPQPYYFDDGSPETPPAGRFEAGTRVVLLVRGSGPNCRVCDGQGLYVVTAYAGLKRLPRRPEPPSR